MDKHQIITNELHRIYKAKNADYGDSFTEQFKKYGILSSLIRIEDKFRRFENLVNSQEQKSAETVLDTLLDLANYSIMTCMELVKEPEQVEVVENAE